jgi:PEP-CTERM motif
MNRIKTVVLSLVLILSVISSANAGMIINGGFETGDFSGWHVNDPSGGTFVTGAFPGYSPHGGDEFAALGATGQLGSISQTLNTTAGTTYILDYFLASDGLTPNEFKVVWGGTTLFDQVNIPAQGYVEYTFQVTAASALTNLTFFERNDNGFLSLDDVSANLLHPPPSVSIPEPSSLTLLGMGITVLLGYRMRRRKKGGDCCSGRDNHTRFD